MSTTPSTRIRTHVTVHVHAEADDTDVTTFVSLGEPYAMIRLGDADLIVQEAELDMLYDLVDEASTRLADARKLAAA